MKMAPTSELSEEMDNRLHDFCFFLYFQFVLFLEKTKIQNLNNYWETIFCFIYTSDINRYGHYLQLEFFL